MDADLNRGQQQAMGQALGMSLTSYATAIAVPDLIETILQA